MLPESSFLPEHKNTKHSVVLQDSQISQEAKYGLSSLLAGDYNSISKSPMDLFQMDIPTTGLPIAWKLYPILLEYQKFISQEIRLLENGGCISKTFEYMICSSNYSTKETRPPKSSKVTASLSDRLPVT